MNTENEKIESESSPKFMNLAKKMLLVMKDVEKIPKNGYNKFHNYKYVKESDVVKELRIAFTKHNVMCFSSTVDRTMHETNNSKQPFLVTVKIKLTFVDADSGEFMVCYSFGDGIDSGDKGIYKAMTGAQKYALMKTFMIETGDDPEGASEPAQSHYQKVKKEIIRNETPPASYPDMNQDPVDYGNSYPKAASSGASDAISDKQLKYIQVLFHKIGLEDKTERLGVVCAILKKNVKSSKDLTKEEAKIVIERLIDVGNDMDKTFGDINKSFVSLMEGVKKYKLV